MPRVKRGTIKAKRRRNLLSQVKGYQFGRSTKKRQAREAIFHAGNHAFAHRRDKKNDYRRLWQVQINAYLRELGAPSYSKFMGLLKKKEIGVNRKMLALLARENPEAFQAIIEKTK
ncbi:MAG TPA: 50S ribosomal protein L20 [Candidatus Paceibacterota bacterium]|nr:50S ribosomal protein L20 [Candidatus Paceibacterota bacterium]